MIGNEHGLDQVLSQLQQRGKIHAVSTSKTDKDTSIQNNRVHERSSEYEIKEVTKRSQAYLEALRTIDLGDSNDVIEVIKTELEEVQSPIRTLAGILSKCYLGRPYDVHAIDASFRILNHFSKSETLPLGLQPGRSVALKSQISAVEVYSDGTILGVYFTGVVEEFIPRE